MHSYLKVRMSFVLRNGTLCSQLLSNRAQCSRPQGHLFWSWILKCQKCLIWFFTSQLTFLQSWKVSLKTLNSGLILKTFTHVVIRLSLLGIWWSYTQEISLLSMLELKVHFKTFLNLKITYPKSINNLIYKLIYCSIWTTTKDMGSHNIVFLALNGEYFPNNQFKHLFWVLKRTVSLGWFF